MSYYGYATPAYGGYPTPTPSYPYSPDSSQDACDPYKSAYLYTPVSDLSRPVSHDGVPIGYPTSNTDGLGLGLAGLGLGLHTPSPSLPSPESEQLEFPPYPLGHAPDHERQDAEQRLKYIQAQIHSTTHELNYSRGAVVRYLGLLDEMMAPLATVYGNDATWYWVKETQQLTRILLLSMCHSSNLDSDDLVAILNYTQRWIAIRGGGCDMSKPEAQIVIRALEEVVYNAAPSWRAEVKAERY